MNGVKIMPQPLLSIGMIVKNEERCLEKCLTALEPLRQAIPCELIIADAGSTDKTREIAVKYADIFFDFVWINDFAKARNAVMDKCTGKWYLTIDADEYLSPDIDELVNFLTNKISGTMKQATFVIRNHFEKNMDGVYSDFNAMRMCRMDTNTRYTGAIHEHFDQPITYDDIYILSKTLFHHDGYAYISKEHKENKEARNLALLEKKLAADPDELRVILQCLESSASNGEKRRYYTKYAIEKLRTTKTNNIFWDAYAEIIAKQVAMYLNYDCDPFQDEWFEWTFKTFPNSLHITVDTTFIYTKYSYIKKIYIDAIKYGKNYLKAYANRTKNTNDVTLDKLAGYLLYAHEFHENEIKTLVANAMIKEKREAEALKMLSDTNLFKQNNTVVNNWFTAVNELDITKRNTDQISKHIYSTFKKYADETHSSYDHILAKISAFFRIDSEKKQYKLFENVPGTIGLCVKIADAKTKEDAEILLNQVENWKEFMPLALKNAIILKAELPKEFYTASPSRTEFLISSLSKSSKDIINELLEYFCNKEKTKDFPQISFVFNLFINILLNNSGDLPDKTKTLLTNKFIEVANVYLASCYNPELLENEKEILCIPTLHLFSWYLVKANKHRVEKPLEYIKTLRTLLKRIPESKPIVEFLIDNFQKEEEVKKQEMIKNASPELVALAEQLKTMLSAFPENSPELLAIKQSPMYKQVAFLIEN